MRFGEPAFNWLARTLGNFIWDAQNYVKAVLTRPDRRTADDSFPREAIDPSRSVSRETGTSKRGRPDTALSS